MPYIGSLRPEKTKELLLKDLDKSNLGAELKNYLRQLIKNGEVDAQDLKMVFKMAKIYRNVHGSEIPQANLERGLQSYKNGRKKAKILKDSEKISPEILNIPVTI